MKIQNTKEMGNKMKQKTARPNKFFKKKKSTTGLVLVYLTQPLNC